MPDTAEFDTAEKVSYDIDREDRIVAVRAGWDQFAIDGDAPQLVQSDVIGHSLWEFIHGDMVERVYKQLLDAVRLGNPLFLSFRCDSPDRRRFLELTISPKADGGVRFETFTKRVEIRAADEIFSFTNEGSENVVVSCSWCKKMQTSENEWHEVEKAVEILQLFDLSPTPQLSHGMCTNCYDHIMDEIKRQS